MKSTLTTVSILAGSALLSGCNGAVLGNLVVLGITFGIFFGTLSLGRSSEATRSAEASTQSRHPRA